MPFRSQAQHKYLWAKHPKLAKRWAHKYGTPKNLPKHKKPSKKNYSMSAIKMARNK